jgi:hypothetical protein
MKTNLVSSFALAAAFLAGGAHAQNATPPAPSSAPAAATPAPAPAAAPSQVIYTPRLPTVTELTNAAGVQGLAVERIEQSASQITATYKNAAGQTNVVSYQVLPVAAPAQTAPAVAAPAPQVVYVAPSPRVVYYDAYDPVYYPRYWYPPVSLSFGFGYRYGHGGFGGFHRHR